MKILLVTGQMNSGGAETHVYELTRALYEAGHSVTLASAGGHIASELCAMGVCHIKLPLATKNPFTLFFTVRQLKRLIRSRKYHIVHAHTRISAFVAAKACEGSGSCLVSTVHAHFRENRFLDALSRWGSAAIAVSEDLRQYLIGHSDDILAENISVIPNGIDTEKFCPAPRESDTLRLVFASRLDGDCSAAAYYLCTLAKKLQAKFENIQIVICGGGSEYARITERAASINSRIGRETVITLGQVDDMPRVLRSADAFVGVSRAALEAMSCAVPVVLAGNEGFWGELDPDNISLAAQSNFCCRGCEDICEEKLFSAITGILSMTEDQRMKRGELLRDYVVAHHSVRIMRERTEQFYKRAIKRKRKGKHGVLLCGYYGFGNMGDDALLVSAVERALNKFSHMPVCALSAHGRIDSRKFGVRCEMRSSLVRLIIEIKNAEVVVFGGGTLFQNTTSARSLWYYLFILILAQRMGKRTELWGNGIGRISGRLARRLSAAALCSCDYVGLRDRESLISADGLAKEHGLTLPHVELEEDLAVRPLFEDSGRTEYILSRLGVEPNKRIAVVAFRGTDKSEYVIAMEKWVRLLAKEGIVPVFAVMFPREDLELCRRICRSVGGVLAYPAGAMDIMGLMKRACIVCGMRYHALVFAFCAGVSFVGFGSEPKIERFCNSHGGIYFTQLPAADRELS